MGLNGSWNHEEPIPVEHESEKLVTNFLKIEFNRGALRPFPKTQRSLSEKTINFPMDIRKWFSPAEGLSQRVVRAGFWSFALRITERLFGVVSIIVLARLLAPTDFGLFGIVLLSVSALETFSQTGFNAALVQKKEDTKPYLDTAWTVQVIRGITLTLTLFLISPYVATFFGTAAAKPILRVIGLSVFLRGFTNIGIVYFRKELEFHKQFAYQFSGTLVNVGVAIPAAICLQSVWALIFGILAGDLVRVVMSYVVHSYRPRLSLEWAKVKELYKFGRWILGSSILVFLVTQGDDIFVGKVLGVTALGFYQIAYRISNSAATEITHTVISIAFPAFSKIQDSRERLREVTLRIVRVVSLLSIPVAGGILAISPSLTHMILGEKWMPIIPLITVLCFQAACRSIGGILGALVTGIGRPDIETKITFVRLLIIVSLVYPLSQSYGTLGVAVVMALQALLTFPILLKVVLPMINLRIRDFLKALYLPLISTSIMVVILLLCHFSFLTEIFIGASIYLSLNFLCIKLKILDEVFGDLKHIINRAKS